MNRGIEVCMSFDTNIYILLIIIKLYFTEQKHARIRCVMVNEYNFRGHNSTIFLLAFFLNRGQLL